MEPERLDELLRGPVPGEAAARERARVRIAAEYERRPAAARRPHGRVVVALAAAALALAAALSPPGDAVADWVRTAVGLRPHTPAGGMPAAGDRLPTAGRLLVSSGGSSWIVEANGRRRRLGAWTGASWSPHGRFVIAWHGRRLAALDRRGHVRWSLLSPRPVTEALWSPSGFRVAYRSGQDLRVVAGDGTGDRVLDPGTFRPMAWRPGGAHVLAYSSGAHVDVVDVDAQRRLARILLPHVPHALAWSADGRRLYVNLDRSLAIYDARGRRTARLRMPGRQTVTDFAPARRGTLVAVARRAASGAWSEVALIGPGTPTRVLFRGDGRFSRVRFSPSGRWLLVAWPLADQWVFLRPGASGAARVLAAARVTRRIGSPGFPHLSGWCCPP
jgi:dipeptidyl aminopeptidase/acylaminoacyl peptidase